MSNQAKAVFEANPDIMGGTTKGKRKRNEWNKEEGYRYRVEEFTEAVWRVDVESVNKKDNRIDKEGFTIRRKAGVCYPDLQGKGAKK